MNQTLVLRLADLPRKTLISSFVCDIHTSVTFARYLDRVPPTTKAVPGSILYYVCGLCLIKPQVGLDKSLAHDPSLSHLSGVQVVCGQSKLKMTLWKRFFNTFFTCFFYNETLLSLQRVIYIISECPGPVCRSPAGLSRLQ